MKGDFTRIPTQRSRSYSGVRLQQGRVQLDADFNEQVEIGTRRDRLTARDVIGPVGAPEDGGGFAVFPAVRLEGLAISGSSGAIAGELGSVLTSADGGATWSAAHAPLGTADLHGIAIPAAGKLVAVGADGTVMRSDGGSWAAVTVAGLESTLRAVSFVDANNGCAVGDGGAIARTTNGGSSWTVEAAPAGVSENLRAVHVASGTHGWAVGDGGRIIATTDGGSSWATRPAPPGFDGDLHGVRFADSSNGLAVGAGGAILATDDGGATWELRDTPAGVGASLRGLALRSGGHAWAVGDDGTMVASHDGGQSWVEADVSEAARGVNLTAAAATGDDVVAIGELSTVIISGEAAWQRAGVPASARDLALSPGRIYVDGTLIVAEEGARLLGQPHLVLDELPDDAGRYLVYLDVWERHLTAVEDPALREVALGGPDTATRTKTVWQAKLTAVDADAECRDFGAGWAPAGAESTGRLRAQAEPDEVTNDECVVPATGGYRRLENQLYRVEVHQGSAPGAPTFVWSRDNGSVLTELVGEIEPEPVSGLPVLTVADTGRDAVGGFFGAKLVELSDEGRLLAGEPGVLVEVERVDERRIVLQDPGPGVDLAADWGPGTLVRRWEGSEELVANGWRPLENGVRVQFGDGEYATGDYWTVPARTATAEVEWPQADGVAQFEPRHGTTHAHAPLALVDLTADGGWTVHDDCRPLFTPLALRMRLSMAGGDGQELDPAAPTDRLPYPLEVSVMNGPRPIEGAWVRFEVFEGGGWLTSSAGAADTVVVEETGPDGLAAVEWTLAPTAERHRVRARLLDRLGNPLDAPIHFNARVAAAGDREEPGVRVEKVATGGGDALSNDGRITLAHLDDGIDIFLDQEIQPQTLRGKPTCRVTLDLPFTDSQDRVTHVPTPIGTIPVTLTGDLIAEDATISWRPGTATRKWFASALRQRLARVEELLVHLTLKGNYIYALERPETNVDGDVFGLMDGGRLDAVLPSGDRRRGGDLEMWFRLVANGEPEPEVSGIVVLLYAKSELLSNVAERWRPFAKALDLGLEREALREAAPERYTVREDAVFDPEGARQLFDEADLAADYRAIAESDLVPLGERIGELLNGLDIPIELETTGFDDPAEGVRRSQEEGEQLDFVIVSEASVRRLAAEMPDSFDRRNLMRL